MSYADIRKTVKMKRAQTANAYKNGGAVKKSATTVNIVVAPARGEDAPKAPPIAPAGAMAPPPSRMPPPPAPMPPAAMQAGLGALAGKPMMASGGRVKKHPMKKADGGKVPMKDGAGGGLGRLEKIKDYGKKAKGGK